MTTARPLPRLEFRPRDEDARRSQWIVEQLVRSWGDGAAWELDERRASARGQLPEARHFQSAQPAWAGIRAGHLDMALGHIVDWHRAWLAGAGHARLSPSPRSRVLQRARSCHHEAK